MIRSLIGASIGRRLAGSQHGTRGALLGMAAPWIARRAMGPLGLALAGGWVAKKIYDRRRSRTTAATAASTTAA
jgi:hypothetical protein